MPSFGSIHDSSALAERQGRLYRSPAALAIIFSAFLIQATAEDGAALPTPLPPAMPAQLPLPGFPPPTSEWYPLKPPPPPPYQPWVPMLRMSLTGVGLGSPLYGLDYNQCGIACASRTGCVAFTHANYSGGEGYSTFNSPESGRLPQCQCHKKL